MKYKLPFIFLLALFFAQANIAQNCLPNGITLSTQTEIDNFATNYPGCSSIGSLDIGGSGSNSDPINNLNGLSQITSISGGLTIQNTSQLTDLSGLGNLMNFSGYIYIRDNALLQTLSGLDNIQSVYSLDILSNPALTSISALSSLTQAIHGITISYNPMLNSLVGLENVHSYTTTTNNLPHIEIISNISLTDLTGFPTLINNPCQIRINNNTNLTTLSGLDNLQQVSSVSIRNNPNLSDLTALQNLTQATYGLKISGTSALTNLNGLQNLTTCGHLTISYNNALTSIAQLGSLSQVGSIFIDNNAALPNLNGLQLLTSAGSIVIAFNDLLTDLTALSNITQLDGKIEIANNDILPNLDGFENILAINDYIKIHSNTMLSDISGLANIDEATVKSLIPSNYQKDLSITDNPMLSNCNIAMMCDFFSNIANHTYYLNNNKPGCNWPYELNCQPNNCPGTIAGYTKLGEFEDHGYYLSNDVSSWQDAQASVANTPFYLASITSAAEDGEIKSWLLDVGTYTYTYAFIGLNDVQSEGNLVWDSGETVDYTNFTTPDACPWCGLNSDQNDFTYTMGSAWGMDNQWVQRKYIIETGCQVSGNGDITLTCPANVEVTTTSNTAPVSWNAPTATTTCTTSSNVTLTQTAGLPSGSDFTLGTHTITFQATDDCSNAQSCSFDVTVTATKGGGECNDIAGFTKLGDFNGHGYYLSNENQPWAQAKSLSENAGGYLASMNNQAENDFLKSKLSNQMVFIGYNDETNEGTGAWANGEPVTLDLSYNNSAENDYAVMNFWAGTWQMVNRWVYKPFVMEMDCGSTTTNQPDLTVSNISNQPAWAAPGAQVDFNFNLNNIGTATATGSYEISMYLSTDEAYSADDILVGSVPTGGTPVGTIADVPAAIAIPGNTPGGNYFLIIVADSGNSIAEANENNNTISISFGIGPNTGSGCHTIVLGYEKLGEYNGHGYYLYNVPVNWSDAKLFAESEGGYLATINDQAENDFLKSKINTNLVFIGYNDAASDGTGAWANNELVTLDLSYDNSPENDYAVMNFWAGTWQMVNQWVAKRFVMEMNCNGANPQPTPPLTLTRKLTLSSIYPNPAQDYLTARILENKEETVQLTIFNATGQAKIISSKLLAKGHNEIGINIHDLEAGMYYLQVTSGNINQTINFVKID